MARGEFKPQRCGGGYNPPALMTTSASTSRLRLTLFWYLGLIVATALTRPLPLSGGTALLVDAAAVLMVGVAVLGRIWCSVFIAGRKDESLVTEGPYANCRHPLYALSLVGGAGLGLATHSVLLTVGTLLLLVVLFSRAAVAEDALLAARHGADFQAYAATTPRFWPLLRRQPSPQHMQIRPVVFWKAFVDAGSFLLLYALIVAARELQALQRLPSLLELP